MKYEDGLALARAVRVERVRQLWPERVDDFHASLFEVRAIARHDRQAMNERGNGD